MGISRLSAYMIAQSDTEIVINGPEDDKYSGVICHSKNHPHHPYLPIVSTAFFYPSSEEAKKAMEDLIVKIKDVVAKEIEGE